MRSHTLTTVVPAPQREVFAYMSEIENLPQFPTRAIELADGRTAYTFTMFQGAGMPNVLFERQYESLKREFRNIEARFS